MYGRFQKCAAGGLAGGVAEGRWRQGRKDFLFAMLVLLTVFLPLAGQAARVSLAWDPPTANMDGTPIADLAGFKIYYGEDSSEYTEVLDVGADHSASISNLDYDKTYYFAVTAYNSAGVESALSPELTWSADADGDGVADAWESLNFIGVPPAQTDAASDPDADGFSNFEEYIAGTCPNTQSSCAEIDCVFVNGAVAVRFDSVQASGHGYEDLVRYYQIQQCSNLRLGNWVPVPGTGPIPGVSQTITYTMISSEARAHYRICSWLE